MTPTSFTYWLHGFFEISQADSLSDKQVAIIKDHLQLCFRKETPDYTQPDSWEKPRLALSGEMPKKWYEQTYCKSFNDGYHTGSSAIPLC